MRTKNSCPLLLASFLILFMTGSASLFAQTIKKGPYLIFPDNNSTMKVLWQDDATATDQIRWGTDQTMSTGPYNSTEYGTDHQHQYTLTGLTPGTKYYYRVQVATAVYNGTFTSAPDPNSTSLKFFAYGDTRTNTNYHDQVAQQINSTWTADPGYQTFIISMGDLVYNGNDENYWTSEFFNYSYPNLMTMLKSLPYESAVGNHEFSGSSTLFPKYFPYPFAGARYYSFDYGPAHFTVVDQYTPYTVGTDQYNWIVSDLAASSKPWKFMFFHEPGWSAGGGHENNTTVQNVLEPLCDQYNVAIVFAGHNHYYARAVVPASNGRTIQHVTAGAAGAPLYTPNLTYPYIVAGVSSHHFCKINIVNEYVLQFEARSNTGILLDAFTIDRTPPPITFSNIQAINISWTTATITWTTNLASSSEVEYGTTTAYGLTAAGTGGVTDHSVQLTGLTANTLYHYRVKSNSVYSGDHTFQTLAPVVTYYAPASASILQGTLNSGTFENLSTNNSVYYSVNSTSGKPRVCSWYGSFTLAEPPSAVYRFTIRYDGKYTRAINQSLSLYNFATNAWVQIDSRSVSTKDVTITYIQNSPASFISSSGEIRLRVYGSNTSKNFTCYGDFMQVAVETAGGSRTADRTAPVESHDVPSAGEFTLYPNPAGELVNVRYELDHTSEISISIYSIMGEKVGSLISGTKKEAGTIQASSDISDLHSGIYIVLMTATNESGEVVRRAKKLIIAR